jgi:mannose-6-phosphate isomerase-like protein (cupin superfamily)
VPIFVAVRMPYRHGMPIIAGAGRFTGSDTRYTEHLRTADLSVGTYCIPVGGDDPQRPHTEDEIYVVTAGRATFVEGEHQVPVTVGDTLVVAAGDVHRFVDVTENFAVVVVFAPPEGTRA